MLRKITALTAFLLSLVTASAQIPNLTDQRIVDSLFQILPKAEGTAKVDVLNQLALNLAPRSYDSSNQFANEGLTLSEKLEYEKGKGIAIFNIGNSYYFIADYKNALLNYLKAVRILEPLEPGRELGNLNLMIGILNQYVSNVEKVQYYYSHAADNFMAIGDTAEAMFVNMLLGVSYIHKLQILWQNDTLTAQKESGSMIDSALKFNSMALDYSLKTTKQNKILDRESMLAQLYALQGQWYSGRNDSLELSDTLGLINLLKGLKQSHEIKDTKIKRFYEGHLYVELGHYYFIFKSKYHDKCFEYSKIGEELLLKTDRYDQYSFVLWLLGTMELDRNNFERSGYYLIRALNYCDTFLLNYKHINIKDPLFRITHVTNSQRIKTWILRDYIRLCELKEDFKTALTYQRKLEEERKKLSLEEQSRQLTMLQVNFEDEIKSQQIEMASKEEGLAKLRLSRSRLWFAGGGGMGVIAFLLIFLYFQRKKYSTEQNALLLRQRLLRSQMNPHFIFNSLSGIQNFIVTEKPIKASSYLSKFAALVRNILESSAKEYVTLEKEISTIENYLELQQVRYAGKFEFTIRVDDALDPESMMIPPMLSQPFIENAIEHGIAHSEKMGQIDVEFRLDNDVILFEVTDNGVGREKARELEAHLEKDHQSMSTSITLERLAMLNKKRKHKIIFEITDLKDNDGNPGGTFVRFGIPMV
jgi:hypothetical protein